MLTKTELDPRSAPDLSDFDWADPFYLSAQLDEEERMVQEASASFAAAELLPRVTDDYLGERDASELFAKMGSIRLPWELFPNGRPVGFGNPLLVVGDQEDLAVKIGIVADQRRDRERFGW